MGNEVNFYEMTEDIVSEIWGIDGLNVISDEKVLVSAVSVTASVATVRLELMADAQIGLKLPASDIDSRVELLNVNDKSISLKFDIVRGEEPGSTLELELSPAAGASVLFGGGTKGGVRLDILKRY